MNVIGADTPERRARKQISGEIDAVNEAWRNVMRRERDQSLLREALSALYRRLANVPQRFNEIAPEFAALPEKAREDIATVMRRSVDINLKMRKAELEMRGFAAPDLSQPRPGRSPVRREDFPAQPGVVLRSEEKAAILTDGFAAKPNVHVQDDLIDELRTLFREAPAVTWMLLSDALPTFLDLWKISDPARQRTVALELSRALLRRPFGIEYGRQLFQVMLVAHKTPEAWPQAMASLYDQVEAANKTPKDVKIVDVKGEIVELKFL